MKKKKTWYSCLVGCIILCCLIFFLLTIWIFHKISSPTNIPNEQEHFEEISQMVEKILPQLSYRDDKFDIKELSASEQLLLATKIAYFTQSVKKATISYGDMKQIQIDAKAAHHILETYFNLSYERNLPKEKKPIFLAYDEIRDLYLFNVSNDFWNQKNTFHYKITNMKQDGSILRISLDSASQEKAIAYEVTFQCKKDCYFINSNIKNR